MEVRREDDAAMSPLALAAVEEVGEEEGRSPDRTSFRRLISLSMFFLVSLTDITCHGGAWLFPPAGLDGFEDEDREGLSSRFLVADAFLALDSCFLAFFFTFPFLFVNFLVPPLFPPPPFFADRGCPLRTVDILGRELLNKTFTC